MSWALTLARLNFFALSNAHSAVVPVRASNIVGVLPAGATLANPRVDSGRVFIVGTEPILDARLSTNGARSLVLYGRPGMSYEVQSTDRLGAPIIWVPVGIAELTGAFEVVTGLTTTTPSLFYRAAETALPTANRISNVARLPDGGIRFDFAGMAGRTYVVEASANLIIWQAVSTNTAPVTFAAPVTLVPPARFFRLRSVP